MTSDDTFFHIKTGELIWKTRSIPTTEIYSYYGEGRPWIVNSWLSDLLLYLIFRTWGPVGTFALLQAVSFATLGILLLLWRRSRAPMGLAAVTLAAVLLAGTVQISLRPLIFSWLLSAIFLYLLYAAREFPDDLRTRRRLWWLLPLTALWPNLHMGFLNGLLIIWAFGAAALTERLLWRKSTPIARPLWVLSLLCPLAVAANPYGFRAYSFISRVGPSMDWIQEWRPLFAFPPEEPVVYISMAILSALAGITLLYESQRRRVVSFLLIIGSLVLALKVRRQLLLYGTVVGAAVAVAPWEELGQAFLRRMAGSTAHRGIIRMAPSLLTTLLLAGTAYWSLGGFGDVNLIPGKRFFVGPSPLMHPIEAADFVLREGIRGRIYNSIQSGGYLIWRLYPKLKVFIDGRVDVYGSVLHENYLKMETDPAILREGLDRYRITCAIVAYPNDRFGDFETQSSYTFARLPDWALVYWDDSSLIYLRRTPENRRVIERYEYKLLSPMRYGDLSLQTVRENADLALAEARRCVTEHPTSAYANQFAARVYASLGRMEEAEAHIRRAIQYCPPGGSPFRRAIHTMLGDLCRMRGDLRQAVAEYRTAALIEPPDPEALDRWGAAAAFAGRLDEAIGAFRRALAAAPESPGILADLALALNESDRHKQALEAADKALALRPKDPDALFQRARAAAQLGDRKAALEALSGAIAGAPRYRDLAREEFDLDPLRSDSRFLELIQSPAMRRKP